MTRSPAQLVTEFCELWASPDPEKLAAFFAEDAVYHNIPMEAVRGREAIKQFITGFTADYSGIDFAVHRQISDGNVVMNERTDTLHRKDGVSVELPVMGVFEIVDDHIAAWRDYFDIAMFTKGLG